MQAATANRREMTDADDAGRSEGEGVKALGDVPTLKSYVKQVSYRSPGTRSERGGRGRAGWILRARSLGSACPP